MNEFFKSTWGKVLSGLILLGVAGFTTFQGDHYSDFWNAEEGIEELETNDANLYVTLEEHEEKIQSATKVLEQMVQNQQVIINWMTTQQGRATQILPPKVPFEEGVHVNTRGNAEQHFLFNDKIRITSVDNPDHPEVVAKITGKFTNSDRGHLLILGRKVARALQMEPTEKTLTIRVELVEKSQ